MIWTSIKENEITFLKTVKLKIFKDFFAEYKTFYLKGLRSVYRNFETFHFTTDFASNLLSFKLRKPQEIKTFPFFLLDAVSAQVSTEITFIPRFMENMERSILKRDISQKKFKTRVLDQERNSILGKPMLEYCVC